LLVCEGALKQLGIRHRGKDQKLNEYKKLLHML
jgi:hypothetical protein